MEKKLLINNPIVSRQVFFPRKTPIPSNLDSFTKILRFPIDKKIIIGGICFIKSTELPTILLFHGNGEVALDYLLDSPTFFECNVNLAVMDYRGYGFSTGEPYYTCLISDALPIYNAFKTWAEGYGLLKSFFIQGRSLGSVCASEIGAHNPEDIKGIIIESGFASLYNMMTVIFRVDSPQLTPNSVAKYSNDVRIQKFKKPTLVIHGREDYLIPYTEGELLYQNLPESLEKKLILIEGEGHNSISINNNIYFSALKNFISKFK
jgi:pimeloyl-ACP methyl ester carboxylesterase